MIANIRVRNVALELRPELSHIVLIELEERIRNLLCRCCCFGSPTPTCSAYCTRRHPLVKGVVRIVNDWLPVASGPELGLAEQLVRDRVLRISRLPTVASVELLPSSRLRELSQGGADGQTTS